MSLFGVFDTVGSALTAQAARLNVTASNLANADAVSSSIEQTYRARHPVFQTMFNEANPDAAGVEVLGIVESQAPIIKEYAPGHPAADADGYIFRPNVNSIEEMANMISASRSYQTNLEVANAAKQMLLRTLTLGR